tara:strand:- start:552 stop:1265 length:714 start_codon:yes stop_codon:yes gene_type:complete
MKTAWGKPVHIIRFCRTLLIVLAVAVCLATLMGCGNSALETERKAAMQGYADAQYYLGVMYDLGDGVAEDDAEAVKWYRMAAEQGYADAQYNLGVKYAEGEGVPENAAEAMKWYRKAVEQGNARAQNNLGVMYKKGVGVPEDDFWGWENDTEAVKWYRKAAEQGNATAQSNLGVMYENGEGVPKDDVVAYAWYSAAAASGHDNGCENRDDIKRRLTLSQLEKGQVMAREIFERIEKR